MLKISGPYFTQLDLQPATLPFGHSLGHMMGWDGLYRDGMHDGMQLGQMGIRIPKS